MDYKQKYEQALERARQVHITNVDENKKSTEYIFPELKESEDEKIKEALMLHIKYKVSAISGWRKEELIDWLEKQGKKVDAIENFNTEFERQISHLIASTINKEHEYNEGFVKWTANALLNYAKHELEKKELKKIEPFKQKPAWSEEDESMLQNILECLKNGWSKLPTDILKYESWLKSFKDRVSPQNFAVTDEELAQAKKDAYNDALDKIEYHSGEPTFDDGWSAAIDYILARIL